MPRLHSAAIHQLSGLHHGHAEARQVIASRAVEARHLRCFAPQQGTAALAAAVGDPLHHRGHRGGAELARSYVVEKEQRLGTTGDHVVDAHRHQVDAHPVMTALGLGQFQLGAHPVGT